ncbi:MAG: hypothetical protein J6C80_06900 [Flavobacteriales bacterium]|nr:hypothetical protein [Flavobacteriales bacterium]
MEDRINYLDWLIDFYFKVMVALRYVGFKNEFRAEMSLGVQMMFTKAKSFRNLLGGFNHTDGINTLFRLTDHTVLFTLVRTAYEQLCAFEIVNIIPKTQDEQIVMENAYVASGLVNRQKLFTEDALKRNIEVLNEEQCIIEECKNRIHNTKLYKSLTEKEQKELDKTIFTKGEYQIVFSQGKYNPHVGWDHVRDYIGLDTDVLHGLYKYACNMAHPSYLSVIQFKEAYKGNAMNNLKETAIMQFTAIMSVYIGDFLSAFSEIKHVYDELDEESKFMVDMYKDGFRERSTR